MLLGWEVAGHRVGHSWRRVALLAGFGALHDSLESVGSADQPVIAVLPFKNLSAHLDTDRFVDALAEDIIRSLAVVPGLQVRSRNSSFEFKNEPRDLQQIAVQLGAALIVEGSAHRDGSRMRVSVQLVQVEGDIRLWAKQFDREIDEIFSIQDEISRAVANRLGLTSNRAARRSISSLEAYDLYLQARALVDRRGIPNAHKAAELFQRAIARDPGFAPAHAGLATAYAFMSFPYRGISFETAYPIMQPAGAQRAAARPDAGGGACGHGMGVRVPARLGERGALIPTVNRAGSEPHPGLYQLLHLDAPAA